MATRPATAPEHTPRMVGFLWCIHSRIVQVNPAQAVAVFVTTNALAASPLAATALPALKPNQPNHNKPVPAIMRGRLCGGFISLGNPLRFPANKHTARPEAPEQI